MAQPDLGSTEPDLVSTEPDLMSTEPDLVSTGKDADSSTQNLLDFLARLGLTSQFQYFVLA